MRSLKLDLCGPLKKAMTSVVLLASRQLRFPGQIVTRRPFLSDFVWHHEASMVDVRKTFADDSLRDGDNRSERVSDCTHFVGRCKTY